MSGATVGEALLHALARRGVDTVFGIPGVHTVEMYRGLSAAGIRHVTARHEQGAGFMADGYARASGRPGVALLITGPGLTNAITPMAQARADSVPILVLSSVNARASLGRGLGHLHELPDQRGLAARVARASRRIERGEDLGPALDAAFAAMTGTRPGPVHVELPLDLAPEPFGAPLPEPAHPGPPAPDPAAIEGAARLLAASRRPVILAGGGAPRAGVLALAERLDAPLVQTVNARGIAHDHPLGVPASPSLPAVRALIESADAVLAIGTELGPTDYDMYATGRIPQPARLVRVDVCPEQLARHPAEVAIAARAGDAVTALLRALGGGPSRGDGASRARAARDAAWRGLPPEMRHQTRILAALCEAVPRSLLVGDSTQPVYAGNLWHDHDLEGGWFNAATGYGALGYGIPAAIGAAIARPDLPVICLTGDGGAQFSLAELMTARDANLPITFVVWNNRGYGEIAVSMREAGVEIVGCDPTPPDFAHLARACGMPHLRCRPEPGDVAARVLEARRAGGPALVEVEAPRMS